MTVATVSHKKDTAFNNHSTQQINNNVDDNLPATHCHF